jgi:hypothetical protein
MTRTLNVGEPLRNSSEGLAIGKIKNDKNTLCVSVVACSYGTEALLFPSVNKIRFVKDFK